METVRFTTRPDGYGCNKPGDNSGEYVSAEIARDLLAVVEAIASFDGRNNNTHLKEMARAALAKAKPQPKGE